MNLSFWEIIIISLVIGGFINQWIKNWKGRKSYTTQVIDSLKDLMKYFFSEASGNIVQKINASLAFSLFLLFLVCLFLFSHIYLTTSKLQTTLLTIAIISSLSLGIVLPVCAKFTRHQYKEILRGTHPIFRKINNLSPRF